MLNWFKKHSIEYPDFWNTYVSYFEEENLQKPLEEVSFVVLDTETTGFNYETDRILCIGAITLKANVIYMNSVYERYIDQTQFNPDAVEIHGLIQHHKFETISETEAMKEFLDYLKDSVIVAHHAFYDVSMLNKVLERHNLPNLKNRYLDTGYLFKKTKAINRLLQNDRSYSLDDVCKELNIPIKDRHTAAGDAMLTAQAFLKVLARLNFKPHSTLKSLLKK